MAIIGVDILRKELDTVLKKVENGETVTIMSHGYEIAQLVPPPNKMEKARKALEKLRETAFVGDVISPIEEFGEPEIH